MKVNWHLMKLEYNRQVRFAFSVFLLVVVHVAELVRGIATRPVKEHVLQHVVMAAIPVMHRDLSYK